MWCLAAAGTWYYGSIYTVLKTDPRLNSVAYSLALLSGATLVTLLVFISGYHGMIRTLRRAERDSFVFLLPRLACPCATASHPLTSAPRPPPLSLSLPSARPQ